MSESEKLGILLYTDPILHEPTEPVEVVDEALVTLAGKMLFCMSENRGVGLSANQIGINKRFCVVSLENGQNPMTLINPVLTYRSKEKIKLSEGCLSCPGIWVPMKRSQKVRVKFTSLQGTDCEYEMTDLDARIIQHEVDHLDGKMIIDKLPKLM